jgi:hypothetical protein
MPHARVAVDHMDDRLGHRKCIRASPIRRVAALVAFDQGRGVGGRRGRRRQTAGFVERL